MKVSKKGEYALRSLINLGIAEEVGRELVQVAELADIEQLPVISVLAVGDIKSEKSKIARESS